MEGAAGSDIGKGNTLKKDATSVACRYVDTMAGRDNKFFKGTFEEISGTFATSCGGATAKEYEKALRDAVRDKKMTLVVRIKDGAHGIVSKSTPLKDVNGKPVYRRRAIPVPRREAVAEQAVAA